MDIATPHPEAAIAATPTAGTRTREPVKPLHPLHERPLRNNLPHRRPRAVLQRSQAPGQLTLDFFQPT